MDTPQGPRPAVTVVVPSHRGAGTIGATLESLAGQTLAADRFEVLVVQNGPPDDTAAVLERVRSRYPALRLRRVGYGVANLAAARNIGMDLARGTYLTFVDDDDTVSPSYLQSLLACSEPDVVGVAHVADVQGPGEAAEFGNRIAPQLVRAGERICPGEVSVALTYCVAKMLPTALARGVRFDTSLRSGEDIPFYIEFFMRYPLAVRLVPLEHHAVYYRTLAPNSRSRRAPSFDFNVEQRLDALEILSRLTPVAPWERSALDRLSRGDLASVNQYLHAHPQDHSRVLDAIDARGLTGLPPTVLNRDLAVDLWILYATPPHVDADTVAATELIRAGGRIADVITVGLRGRGPMDRELDANGWRRWVDHVHRVSPAASDPTTWAAAERFADEGVERLAKALRKKPVHERVHTFGSFPAAALLAARYRQAHPSVRWIAHFSAGAPEPDAGDTALGARLRGELTEILAGVGAGPPTGNDLASWARHLALALADETVVEGEAPSAQAPG
jgi:glycosyltransferase involved in cell wall biosynthesis